MASEMYFSATDSAHGTELWKFAGVVTLAKDIAPGDASSNIEFYGFTAYNNSVYFAADDSVTGTELWKIDPYGNVTRASDIYAGAGSSQAGYYSQGFVEFNGELYFSATGGPYGGNMLGGYGTEPWKLRADGTTANVADINPTASSIVTFTNFVEFNNELYFAADDGTTGLELWKIKGDGTAAQVADINPGAAYASPNQFIVYNKEMYFSAEGPGTGQELWKVKADGSVVMVKEINPGAGGSGIEDFRLFNSQLYFTAGDGDSRNIWFVSDNGVVQQHSTFPDVVGIGQIGTFGSFTEFNGGLYFTARIGQPNVQGDGLWRITDGVTAERVSPFLAEGDGFNDYQFTLFGNGMYFAHFGDNGRELAKLGLDGIIADVTDINPGPLDSNPGNLGGFEIFNNELYFDATTAAGDELWFLNGGIGSLVADIETSPGASSFPRLFYAFNRTTGGALNDFNGDGKGDVLFSQEGAVFASNYQWQLDDRAIAEQGPIDLYDKAFTVQVLGDFDGDGQTDVVFQNPTTGGVWMWQLDGTAIRSQGAVDVADPSYHLLGSADFNGDGKHDLMFRNDAGFVYLWQMNGRVNTPLPVQALDPEWHVVGAGDFDGDHKADLLLRNVSNTADNGAFFLWKMDGNQIVGQGGIERPSTAWQTLGLGDFDGDGKTDFAVRNVSNTADNGAVWVYLMDGTTIQSQGAAGIADAATWHVQQIGDLNGDGKDDILFRNDAGYFYSWNMNGATIASEGLTGAEAGNWADPALKVVTQHWDLV